MSYFQDIGTFHESAEEAYEIRIAAKKSVVKNECLVGDGQLHDGDATLLAELALSGHELGVKTYDGRGKEGLLSLEKRFVELIDEKN